MSTFSSLNGRSDSVYIPGTGTIPLSGAGQLWANLEDVSGLTTQGTIYVYGNENAVNQTIAIYTYNLSYYPVGNRYVHLKEITRNTNENGYGNVYLYLSTYSGSWTTTDQYATSTSASISDVYVRNAVGQAANYGVLLMRTTI